MSMEFLTEEESKALDKGLAREDGTRSRGTDAKRRIDEAVEKLKERPGVWCRIRLVPLGGAHSYGRPYKERGCEIRQLVEEAYSGTTGERLGHKRTWLLARWPREVDSS